MDFQRHPANGAPYVNHLDRITQRNVPARVMYGRPSGLGHQIEDSIALKMWSERQVAIGAAVLAEHLPNIIDLDQEDPDHRAILDTFVVDAKEAAGAHIAANRGTKVHEITAELDRGELSPLTVISAEELGIAGAHADALIKVWDRTRDRFELEVLAIEAAVICDRWRLAGHLDRIVRLGRDLSFGTVTIPADTVCVLDVKTGRIREDDYGSPLFWHSYAVQVAAYSISQPYHLDEDRHLERRELWPWDISHHHGLLLHLDVASTLEDGEAVGRLFYVNVLEGIRAGNIARSARDWQHRSGLFLPSVEGPLAVAVATF